jgi:hypothetical protein
MPTNGKVSPGEVILEIPEPPTAASKLCSLKQEEAEVAESGDMFDLCFLCFLLSTI